MHCMGFVVLTYKLLGDDRPLPRFSSTKEELSTFSLQPFDELSEGDFLLLRRKKIKDDDQRRRQRIFSHFALKFDQHHTVHFSDTVRITDIATLMEKRIQITRDTLQNIMYDPAQRIYEYRDNIEAAISPR